MPDKTTSYLASVKEELRSAVTDIRSSDEELDDDGITNKLWKLFETKLKESFMNGKKAAGNGSAPSEAKRGNWKK